MQLTTVLPTPQAAVYADAASHTTPDTHVPDCAGGESFALMVMGHSMAPEFLEGEIIIIEPEGLVKDGSYVLARKTNPARYLVGSMRSVTRMASQNAPIILTPIG